MAVVYLNGEYVPAEEAKISVFDHGFLYGDGLFETMRSYGGRIFKLEEHLARLERGATYLDLALPWSREELTAALQGALERNGLEDAYIRLTLSRGPGPIGLDPRLCPRPTLVIMAKPIGVGEEIYRQGVKVTVASVRRLPPSSLDPGVKSLNFLNNILAKREAVARGAYEAILLNPQGFLAEGTVSNLFWLRDNRLYTPSQECGLLPGVTRGVVLELAREMGLKVEEGFYPPEVLDDAQEVFLTNSGSEVIPVAEVDGKVPGGGGPGSITLELLHRYRLKARGC